MEMKSIAIIGLGLIGGSLAKSIKHSNTEIKIAAYDFNDILDRAAKEKVIDISLPKIYDALNYDYIFLALPIEQSIKVFEELIPLLESDQIISDLCSVKEAFAQKWNSSSSKGMYVGLHPMAGKEKGGYLNSDYLLFENSVCIVSTDSKNSQINSFLKTLKSTGMKFTFLDPALHDKIVAQVSHLPQLLSIAMVNTSTKSQNGFRYLDFAAGGFRDMTRIASSSFFIWKDILKNNKTNVIDSLKDFQSKIGEYIQLIHDDNYELLEIEFESAHKNRNEIPSNNKGFLSPLFDITIFVEDKPGMFSKITTILFENNINIKDIELLKIREGSGGNFKLYFETESDANNAIALLGKAGFKNN